MADIAGGCDIPRTALYRIFDSKEAIFTALVEQTHEEALALAEAELVRHDSLETCIEQMLLAREGHLLNIGHSGPHADEIAELYSALAGDLAARYNKRFENMLASTIRSAIRRAEFELPRSFDSVTSCARLLRLSLEGIKHEVASPGEFPGLATQCIRALLST